MGAPRLAHARLIVPCLALLLALAAAMALASPTARAAGARLAIGGSPVEGGTLAVRAPRRGAALSWRRCRVGGSPCIVIARARGARYVVAAADVGYVVRAASGTGRHPVLSNASARILPKLPTAAAPPTIGGVVAVDHVLTANVGTWLPAGRALTFGYQWQRCTTLGTCSPVAGATAATYVVAAADQGMLLEADITAASAVRGATSALGHARTARTASVPFLPVIANGARPTVTGTPREGATLHATRGSWTASTGAAVAVALQWQRCQGGACTEIAGESGDDHVATVDDVGSQLRVQVSGSIQPVVTTATSDMTTTVAPVTPSNVTVPTITPTSAPAIGVTLTAATGSWSSPDPTTYTYAWQRCTPVGSGTCTDIAPAATAATYVTTVADAGSSVRVRVTAHHLSASGTASSGESQAVVGVAPTSVTLPAISGQAVATATLTAGDGTWSGPGTISLSRDWLLCDNLGGACVSTGGTGTTFTSGVLDVGATVALRVSATNAWGTTVRTSAATAPLSDPSPANTVLPAIDSTNLYLGAGGVATVGNGTWSGLAPLAYAYQWQRCDAAGTPASCVDLPGENAASHTIVAGDVGVRLRVHVAASNAVVPVPGVAVDSTVSAVVAATPVPVNATLPSISGIPTELQVLTGSVGTWTGPGIAYDRQWLRCDASGAACTSLVGQTGATLSLGASEIGTTIRLEVTAHNTFGSAAPTRSLQTAPIAARPPSADTQPSITGTAGDTQTLTAHTGTWSGSATITFAYQWLRCTASCSPIALATAATYVLTGTDIGTTIKVTVTATNAGGSVSATSGPTTSVVAVPPTAGLPLPTIAGTAASGQLLSVTNGTWTGSAPIGFALPGTYAWQRCDTGGANCVDIAGATANTYTVVAPADVGATLRAVVRASNAAGLAATPARSAATSVVTAAPVAPALTAVPAIAGNPYEGATLTATNGTFTGTPTFTYTNQWRRCAPAGAPCVDIGGATAATYLLVAADVGKVIRVVNTATNAVGNASGTSLPTATVIHTDPPTNTRQPAMQVDPYEEGMTVNLDLGDWAGTPSITLTQQWQRCRLDGTACVDIAGATDPSYVLAAADVHKTVLAKVHASSPFGQGDAQTDISSEVAPSRTPVNSGLLPSITQISGVTIPEETQTLTADVGGWSGSAASFTYQWQRCNMFGAACAPLVGHTGITYDLTAPDVGTTLRVVVTATNAAAPGGVAVTSAETPIVIAATAPTEHNLVSIVVGADGMSFDIQQADDTEWDGTKAINRLYQWQHCTSALPASCTDWGSPVPDVSYSLVGGDIGFWLRVIPEANNKFIGTAWVHGAPSNIDGPVRVLTPPVNVYPTTHDPADLPSITGDSVTNAVVQGGDALGHEGTWAGAGPPQYRFQWQRCTVQHTSPATASDATGCSDILGATVAPYVPTVADIGTYLRIRVVGYNGAGDGAPAFSVTTPAIVAGVPPTNDAVPALSAVDSIVGSQVTTSDGAWHGTQTITFVERWQRCNLAGTTCADILDQGNQVLGTTYTLQVADIGSRIRSVVTAHNGVADVEAVSLPWGDAVNGIVAAQPPDPGGIAIPVTNTSEPGDVPHPLQVMHVDPGTWGGTPTVEYAHQWQACDDAAGTNCVDIVGAIAGDYTVTQADIGKVLKDVITGSNPSGVAVVQDSDYTSPVIQAVQTFPSPGLLRPTVEDAPERTVLQTATTGDWSGSQPITLATQWQRCTSTDVATCSDITGATAATYTPLVLDLTTYLRVVVTASNGNPTDTVLASPISAAATVDGTIPSTAGVPTISGAPVSGSQLFAVPGTWTGTNVATMVFSFQWQRCSGVDAGGNGTGCNDIAGANLDDGSYTADASDQAKWLRVLVTGHNTIGVSAPVASTAVGPIG